jgi:hypothetical protein
MTDILDAKETVDWAKAQLPSFSERIEAWLADNIYTDIREQPPRAEDDVIVVVQRSDMPRRFNVEVGVIINAIRSSLDILATAIAYRYSMSKPEDVYFPVVRDEAIFKSGKGYKGAKFVNALPLHARQAIEALRPYKGGNDALWRLHDLDIIRKHKRLLQTAVRPKEFHIIGWGIRGQFTPTASWMPVSDQETVIGLLRKGTAYNQMKVAGYVTFDETGPDTPEPAAVTLANFLGLADSIINLFDLS